jgi:type I restriction enzyme S subunit
VIAGERQKLALLQQHKKGLLQQLFPQEGETVPKLRFKEFENSGEWEVKRLGEVYEFKPTNSFSRDCLNYENGLVKNIHYGDIHTKFDTLFDISKEKVPFINPYLPIEKIKEESYCKEGDIIFADASEDLNDVGKSIEIINLNNEKVVSGLHTLLARQKGNLLVIGFGGFLFKSEWVRKQIQKEAQGAKVFGISATRISNVKIKFPKNKSEQQKIAACLSSLDDLITAQTQKIELLEQHKKGLVQGLFPNVNDNE